MTTALMTARDASPEILGTQVPPLAEREPKAGAPIDAKEAYRRFSEREPGIPIYSRGWWLDAVAGPDAWDVALVRKGDDIRATLPYVIRRRYGLTVLGQPPLTQNLGPWLDVQRAKPAARMADEKELMQALIDRLPAFDHFAQNWHYGRTNWLPFYWNGFKQTTRYCYLLTGLISPQRIWSGFHHNARNECHKALQRHRLRVRSDLPIDVFLKLNRRTFERQGMDVPYSDELVRRLDAACAQRGCRKTFIATDPDGRPYAGVYVVWDENGAYALMSGADPALRNSGAASLCFWEAVRHAAGFTARFDFGGSMMEPVEHFFRGFGAHQVPYFCVSKTPSLLLRARQSVLGEWNGA
ncbi:MAG TPA: GNAT family N-acetyltransferase [Paucimonas sp.]|nr:GNAT family N-acetyltransferase [Paucimonas sp.]